MSANDFRPLDPADCRDAFDAHDFDASGGCSRCGVRATGPAFVKLNSWAGITRHRIKVTGWRRNRAIAVWDDAPALRRGPGDILYPPADSIEWPSRETP